VESVDKAHGAMKWSCSLGEEAAGFRQVSFEFRGAGVDVWGEGGGRGGWRRCESGGFPGLWDVVAFRGEAAVVGRTGALREAVRGTLR